MTVVELRHEDATAERGAVVGAVQVLDERLVTVTTSVVRAGEEVPLELPDGRYFADGWSPDGTRLYGAVDTAESASLVVWRQERPNAEAPSGWLHGWRYTGRGWTQGWSLEVTECFRCDDDAGSAVVWLPEGGAPRVFVVPTWTDLVVKEDGVAVKPGIGATLLGYFHRGDRYSAHVVAREALATGCGSDLVTDIATGYYLVCGGHPEASDWMSGLTWCYPDSVDVTVLHAHLMLREGQSLPAVRHELLRAATGGLPFVAEGLRLLATGLATLGEGVLARPYTKAQLGSALTSFWGDDPRTPSGKAQPWDVLPAGAASWPAKRTAPAETPRPPGEALLRDLNEALGALRDGGIGLWPVVRHVVAGDLRLKVAVERNSKLEDRFDLELTAESPTTLRGLTIGVREPNAVHHLGSFDDRNRFLCNGVRRGRWTFMLCEPPAASHLTGSVVPLPVAAPALDVLAAAGDDSLDEVLRATTRTTVLVLLRERHHRGFRLEATRPRGDRPLAVAVEYGTTRGETAMRLAPYLSDHLSRRAVRIECDDFDAAARWQVAEELTPADVTLLDPADLVPSLTALSPDAVEAWRAFAEHLPEAHRRLVERCVT